MNSIQQVRNQIVDAVLVVGGLIGLIVLGLSLSMSTESMWSAENVGLSAVILYVAGLAILRKRVSYDVKTITVIASIYVIGVLNLIGWGLVGSGGIWFVLMILLTMIFHSTRSGLLSYAVVVATLAIVSFLLRVGLLSFDLDFTSYALSDSAWLSRMIIIVLVCAMMVASVGRIIEVLREQLEQYRQRSDELVVRTRELTGEMKRREDAELKLAEVIDYLQDLDRLKDSFIDSVSHELRTPIANIQLYHQLLGMKPEKKDEYLATLKQETERLSYIVEQMLHASGDSSDMALTTMVDIELKDFAIHLFRQQIATLEAKRLTLTLPEDNEEFVILASPEHIERALANLIDNAVKYSTEDGQIDVRLLRQETPNMHMVGVAIQNTGDCPSENERNIIFERFVRGETSLNMGVAGAGLGLPIAKQIAEKYGGRIELACDETHQLVTFTLWLPSVLPMTELLSDDTATPISST